MNPSTSPLCCSCEKEIGCELAYGALCYERQCAWCRRMNINGQWVVATPKTNIVTHGICEECAAREFGSVA